MEAFLETLRQNEILAEALDIWSAGGWAMIALALNAFILFFLGFNVWMRLKGSGYQRVPEKRWRRWISAIAKGEKGMDAGVRDPDPSVLPIRSGQRPALA